MTLAAVHQVLTLRMPSPRGAPASPTARPLLLALLSARAAAGPGLRCGSGSPACPASLTVHAARPQAGTSSHCPDSAGTAHHQLDCSLLLRLSRQGWLCRHRPRTAPLCSAPGLSALLCPRQGLSVPVPSAWQREPWWRCARCWPRRHRSGSARSLSLLSGTWLPALLSGSCCLRACAVVCPLSCHTSSGSRPHRLARWPRGRSHSTRICRPSAVSAVRGRASIDSTARSHPL